MPTAHNFTRRVKGRKGDQRPLGEGLSRRRETKQGGRVMECGQSSGARQRVLGKERDGLMRLLASREIMMMMMTTMGIVG